jgi:hypothetical protein
MKSDEPERPHVARGADLASALRLLRRHPVRRASRRRRPSRACIARLVAIPVPGTVREDLRDTEVEHLHHRLRTEPASLRDEDVRGLQIAMHDPRGVRGAHRVAHLLEDRKDGGRGERAFVRHELRQILAVEQLHGEPRRARRLVDARSDDRHHVLARDARAHARFLGEARAQLRARDELGPHHLERAELRGVPLLGDVHGAHAALAQLPHDPEVAREERTGREGRKGAWHILEKRTAHSAEKTERRS